VSRRLFICTILLLNFSYAYGQISGNNLLELQFGKLPTDTVRSFPTLYDRAVLDYRIKRFKGGVALEQFYSPYGERNYLKLQQVRLEYKSRSIQVNVGNFYETLGRGTLLRSYQIQGAILEDLSFRSRHYFHRDMLGANFQYQGEKLIVKALYGSPLNNLFPPNQSLDDRRSDNIGALYLDYNVKGHTVGGALMHLDNDFDNDLFGMLTFSGSPTDVVSYFAEFSTDLYEFNMEDNLDDGRYAAYFNLNLSYEKVGISTEYKYYSNFLLGAGFNEPPALVKEHIYRVLNRSTHVMQPQNEQGYQIEAFFQIGEESMLTLNNALAINNFGQRFVFQEYFAEYATVLNKKHDLKLFLDYAEDPFKSESSRISLGAYAEWQLKKRSGLKTEIEFQTFSRGEEQVTNVAAYLGYSYHSKLSAGIVTEFSNDSFIMDTPEKVWIGFNGKYKLNNKNTLIFFAGQRRGGPACNSGVCYEVLDFEGVEMRLTSRF
jgi:hypothetical protein